MKWVSWHCQDSLFRRDIYNIYTMEKDTDTDIAECVEVIDNICEKISSVWSIPTALEDKKLREKNRDI
jgi:hypothetical protein